MSALKLNLGGAPSGPAGTGKTETVKDLSKALAKQCVVFNCSESMDYIMIGKFFKGLSSAGAWCCFDEFNRINIEVLSVIGQQLQVLLNAKAQFQQFVEFEGSLVRLDFSFSMFITMNPGYSGRTELPDNLKALFRPVAMMIPDYGMIAEILLYSFGFKQGRILAMKIKQLFKIASEVISFQDHYDFGLRSFRSVIVTAGILRKENEQNEDLLIFKALKSVNLPKLLPDDVPLFTNILKDLFYQDTLDQLREDQDTLRTKKDILNHFQKNKMQIEDTFLQKILQLNESLKVRHGLILLGHPGSGKTTNYRTLKKIIGKRVHCKVINPKSISLNQLYGYFNENSHEWNFGILEFLIVDCLKNKESLNWIVFDGPIDSIWIESLNTVLDDNKKLCLNSGLIYDFCFLFDLEFWLIF
ncbi:hypothetical protein IMG5_184910 [Ichthyophthirius multifiliis]|uniref:Dynein heavy chain hydrolytic ATP-binding dynein motor region domain-containing protein n=1 Tax=Ichthyophthirius multifiliis TaxID=5932 RepID=G0R3E7_ICHMU|nr:hypothetical protein IMG5_184910 [Ichthyophthirius multifiliis]EGR28021.1 hypothetical protein IMG5_184910 [Ichthyophthirius multifiliis]|eukprot:XP_004027366.1 hypothetical protein IMG5_184910 [Ichthyophthirius multifiliis]